MRSIEANGKSVDEAIFKGLQELEISIDEAKIEIIQNETKGVFGIGSRPAIVRITEKEEDLFSYDEDMFFPGHDNNEPETDTEEGYPKAADKGEPREARQQRAKSGARNAGKNTRPQRIEKKTEEQPAIDYSLDLAKGNPAALFLSGMLEKMGVKGNVLAAAQEDGIRLRIDSETMGILIGHRGETLDALQYLTSLVVNRSRKEDGFMRVTLDTENYRSKREETLQRLARKIASQVKAAGKPRALEPMNPYERRILHAALQNNPYVSTYSEGVEPNRRVIVAPKQKNDRIE
jgi:spoIIIJ-associated protein